MKAFRKLAAGLMALCIAAPLTALSASALEPPRPKGDINLDGVFNLSDMVMFSNYLHGKGNVSDTESADMNGDGGIDVFDYIAMRKELLGMLTSVTQKYQSSGTVSLCAGIEESHPDGTSIDNGFRQGQAEFSLELFKRQIKEDENVLVSPYSVMQALAMTANGADGETKKEMERVLGGLGIDDLDKYLSKWRSGQPNNEKCKLLTANSVWVRDNESLIKPQPTFIQNVVDYFGADVFKAPFDNSTVSDINSWVSDNTDKMIPEMLDSLSAEDMMVLVNAVTFDAEWEQKYDPYSVTKYNFTAYDGTKNSVQMLTSMEYTYLEDENAAGVMKYYKGGDYAFLAMLPNEGVSVTDYVNSLTVEKMADLYEHKEQTSVITGIPKFKYDSDMMLKDTLIDMGMETAFDVNNADFTNMAADDSLPLCIGDVIHKTHIELDEQGTRAAAATAVVMKGGAMAVEKEVILDRPFVYAIVDTKAGLPVFMGTVMEIEEE